MNVSLAAIITAHLLVTGKTMDQHMPFTEAAKLIQAERKDWAQVMIICGSNEKLNVTHTYPQLAAMAAKRLGGDELLQYAIKRWRAVFDCFSDHTDADVLAEMRQEFDRLQPFGFCKKYELLVDGSGEDFALQYMAAYNRDVCHAY